MIEKVDGDNKTEIFLYALSTCVWCKKTKTLLDSMGVSYSYVFMDLADEKDKEALREQLKKWNPDCSFPTLVFNEQKCVVGFDEDAIRSEISK